MVYHYCSKLNPDSKHHVMTSGLGQSNTDSTFYRPSIDSVRSGSVGSPRVGLYDFPDGKDTGERYQPIVRNLGIDITEVNSILDNLTSMIVEKKSIDKKNVQAELDRLKATVNKDGKQSEKVEDSSATSTQ